MDPLPRILTLFKSPYFLTCRDQVFKIPKISARGDQLGAIGEFRENLWKPPLPIQILAPKIPLFGQICTIKHIFEKLNFSKFFIKIL